MKISRFIVMAVFGLGLISQNSLLAALKFPKGSYKETCDNCFFRGSIGSSLMFSCSCKKKDQQKQNSTIIYSYQGKDTIKLKNNDGRLERE